MDDCDATILKIALERTSTKRGSIDTIRPVSYTHLDVYKRQVPYCGYCLYKIVKEMEEDENANRKNETEHTEQSD